MKRSRILLGVILFAWSGLSFAGEVEAKKDGVEVFAAADKSSAVVSKLKKGESAVSKERSGMYWQVQLAGGQTGFVSVLAVKIKANAKAGLNDALREAVKSGREAAEQKGARSRSAVMGVRGLDDNDTAMAGSVRPNLRAVYALEDMEVPQAKLDRQGAIIQNDIIAQMNNQK
jgi:hypothetical protein